MGERLFLRVGVFFLLFFSFVPAQPNKPSYQEQGSVTCEGYKSSWGRGGRWSGMSYWGRYLGLWQGVELTPNKNQAEAQLESRAAA